MHTQKLSDDKIGKNEISWACSVHGERRGELYTGFWWGGMHEGDHFRDPNVDGTIILRWIIRNWDRVWTGSSWLRIVTSGTQLCVNEPSDTIQCEEFLYQLKTG